MPDEAKSTTTERERGERVRAQMLAALSNRIIEPVADAPADVAALAASANRINGTCTCLYYGDVYRGAFCLRHPSRQLPAPDAPLDVLARAIADMAETNRQMAADIAEIRRLVVLDDPTGIGALAHPGGGS